MSLEVPLCLVCLCLIAVSVYDHCYDEDSQLTLLETELKGNVSDVFKDLTRVDSIYWLTPWFSKVNPVDKRPLSDDKVLAGVLPVPGLGYLSIPLLVNQVDRSSGLISMQVGVLSLTYTLTPSLGRPAHTTFTTEMRVDRMSRVVKAPLSFLLYHTYKRHLFALRYSFQEKYNTVTPVTP